MSTSETKRNRVRFSEWLSLHTSRKDAVGSFAKSVVTDSCWPLDLDDDYLALRNHVRAHQYDDSYAGRISSFEISWEEYQARLINKEAVIQIPLSLSAGNAPSAKKPIL